MAAIFDWFLKWFEYFGIFKKNARILFLGLDNAGKTTLLHLLKDDRLIAHPPTFQPNMEEFTIGNVNIKAWDLGGHQQARRVWQDYLVDVDGIVFIVDASDGDRLYESRRELDALFDIDELKSTPFLILGNKIDLPSAPSEHVLRQSLGLMHTTGKTGDSVSDGRAVELFMCSVIKRMGYSEGFRWLERYL